MDKTEQTILTCRCASCGKEGRHEMTAKEAENYCRYQALGREAGTIAELFPDIPAWIRLGAIESLSGGKTYCPRCRRQ